MSFRPAPDWLAPQPLATALALPAPFYADPTTLTFEQRAIFARSWQLVAVDSQLANPGDHVVTEIAGVPLLLVRGSDGVLRALHNACRHRAGPLATCDGKGAKALRCRYHGWTYTLEGALRSATEMKDVEDFDPSTIRLPEARAAVWRGLVFAALGDTAPSLDALMAGIGERLGECDFSGWAFHRRISYPVACNWKVYVENYLEGYHVPHIHPGLNALLDYRSYVTETGDWHSLQYSPMESDGGFYGNGEALYYFLWPNAMLNVLPGRLQTNRVVPLGVDRCRVDFDYYYATEGDAAEEAKRRRDQDFSDEVQFEDREICEAVQLRLASGSYLAGRLNPKRENAVHHFHELMRRAWREADSAVTPTA